MDEFEQRGELPALICGATGKEISFAGKSWVLRERVQRKLGEGKRSNRSKRLAHVDLLLFFRNEFTEPPIWLRLAQPRLEGR